MANGTAYYFDVNGATAGFGSPTGTIANNIDWSTSSAGTSATGAYAAGAQLTFGASSTDLAGSVFTINLSTSTNFTGILINSMSANVTLSGTANAYLNGGQTWTVAAGSMLNASATYSGNGMNFNNQALTLAGGGTINFGTTIGQNSNGLITQNMTGTGTVNLLQTAAATSAYSGGYTLTAGTLNFGTGSAAVAFSQFASGKLFSINGGTIDNTGTSAQTLSLGSGTYSFGGDFTFAGTQNLSLGTAAVALTANRSITTAANTLTIGGAISGTGFSLTKAGLGTLTLAGANTYNGTTNVNGGTLALDYSSQNNSRLSDTAALVLAGGALQLSGGTHTEVVASTTLNSGAASVTRPSGTSLLRLNAITRNVGSTMDFGAASIADTDTSNTNGILGGWATVGGTDWAVSATSAADTAITALATYTTTTSAGNTVANYLSANITADSNQSPSAAITPNSLRFNNSAANTLTLTGTTNTITSGGILVTSNVGNNLSKITGGTLSGASGTDLVIIQNNTSNGLTIESIIANNSTATGLTKSGAGLLTLSGANTYNGSTTINAGTLKLNNATAINSTSGLTVSSGATFDTNGNNSTIGTLSGSGTVTNNAASGTATVKATGGAWTGSISDGSTAKVALTLNNTSAINLGGTNTFTGGLTIGDVSNTPLTVSSGAALGNGLITVANNSSLRLTTGQTITGKTVSISGTGGGPSGGNGNGALNLVSGTATWAGDVLCGAGTKDGRIGVSGAGTLTISGNISNTPGTSGVGLDVTFNCDTTLGSGIVILSGTNNNYTGSTIIGRGVLQISASNILPSTSILQVGTGGSAGARFDLNGFNQTVGGLQRTAANALEASVLNNGAADSTLTISTVSGSAASYNGTIKDGTTNKVSIIKTGSGNQTLIGVNTYTGGTAIKNGSLILAGGNDRLSPTGSATLGDTGTTGKLVLGDASAGSNQTLAGLSITGSGGSVVGAHASNISVLTLNMASGVNTFGGTLGGGGTNENNLALVKSGVGNLTLTGSNTFTGNTTVNSGNLIIGSGGSLTQTGNVVVTPGGSLLIGASNVINDSAKVAMAGGTIGFTSTVGTAAETLGALTLTANSILDFGNANPHTFSFGIVNLSTFTLSVYNWTGTPRTAGGNSQFIPTGTPANLSQVSFYSDAGSSFIGIGMMAGSEIVPVPEPGTILAGALLLGGLGFAERKRVRRLLAAALRDGRAV